MRSHASGREPWCATLVDPTMVIGPPIRLACFLRGSCFPAVSVAMFGFLLPRVIDNRRASETPAPAPAHRHRGTRRAVPIATDTAMDAVIDWQLTNRELQIIDDLLHGWPNKQI